VSAFDGFEGGWLIEALTVVGVVFADLATVSALPPRRGIGVLESLAARVCTAAVDHEAIGIQLGNYGAFTAALRPARLESYFAGDHVEYPIRL
jgi:hypothetical protein